MRQLIFTKAFIPQSFFSVTYKANSVDFCPYEGTNTILIFILEQIVCTFQLHWLGYLQRKETYHVLMDFSPIISGNFPPRLRENAFGQSIEPIYIGTLE